MARNLTSSRRTFLTGSAAAIGTMAVPAAATVSQGLPEKPDWLALHAELNALDDKHRIAERAFHAALAAAEREYPERPRMPLIEARDDETWRWSDEATTEVLGPNEAGFFFPDRVAAYFQRELRATEATARRGKWPPGYIEAFREETARRQAEVMKGWQDWQETCETVRCRHRVHETARAADVISDRIDELESKIRAAPPNSLAAIWVKLEIVVAYLEADEHAETLLIEMRKQIEEAGLHRQA